MTTRSICAALAEPASRKLDRNSTARARWAKWNAAHPERARILARKWHETHKEQMKAYRARMRQHRQALAAAWCAAHPELVKAYRAKNAAKHKDEYQRRARVRKHGLTRPAFLALLEEQGKACPVCLSPLFDDHKTHIDHDHETGVIRGLLCLHCNKALGFLRDSAESMERAISYLRRGR